MKLQGFGESWESCWKLLGKLGVPLSVVLTNRTIQDSCSEIYMVLHSLFSVQFSVMMHFGISSMDTYTSLISPLVPPPWGTPRGNKGNEWVFNKVLAVKMTTESGMGGKSQLDGQKKHLGMHPSDHHVVGKERCSRMLILYSTCRRYHFL